MVDTLWRCCDAAHERGESEMNLPGWTTEIPILWIILLVLIVMLILLACILVTSQIEKKRTLRLLQGSEDLMKEYLRVHSQYIGKISSLSTQLVDQAIPDHIDLELHNIQDEQILAGSTGESDLAMGGSAPSSLQPDSDDEK